MGRWALGIVVVSAACAHIPPSPSRGPLVDELVTQYGEGERARIERGIEQVQSLWDERRDGNFAAFARAQFVPTGEKLDQTFGRFESVLEQVEGHLLEAGRALRWGTDVEGPLSPVDSLLAGIDPGSQVSEDFFASKAAFSVLLNFPRTSLAERLRDAPNYSRERFAEDRLTLRFRRRVPPEIKQRESQAAALGDLHISQYNIFMHHLVDASGTRLFPKGLRLISHWNLRDEIKSDYADPNGLTKQRAIVQVMQRIVEQSVPSSVINNPALDWNPWTNAVSPSPPEEREEGAAASEMRVPLERYVRLLEIFRTARAADAFSPTARTAIDRTFEAAEIPQERLIALLTRVLESPLVGEVGALIASRLHRPLEAHDLWYDGFKARSQVSEASLTEQTRARYPDPQAFAKDIPRLLQGLGFPAARARFIAEHIRVDPSRGAGHALPAVRRGDFPRLRTRIPPGGMDYKGYNIAVHELGHNVEQVLSLYEIDHTLLAGVPNTAFTEALAFVFQERDLDLLRTNVKPDKDSAALSVLNAFWQTWEIAGVALVELEIWKWMYAHPDASAIQLRDAVVEIAQTVWRRYYAPHLGGHDSVLLGIYSHMISMPLYLFNYPLGHLIAFQLEGHFQRHPERPLGVEFERMVKAGAITPDLWMINATGEALSAEPLLKATEAALKTISAS